MKAKSKDTVARLVKIYISFKLVFLKNLQNYFLKMQINNMLCWNHSCFLCKKLALNIHTYRKHTFEEFWDVLTSKQSMYFFKTSTSKLLMICFFYLISHIKIIILFYNFAFITRSYIDILKTTPSIDKKQSFNTTNFPVKFLTQQTTPRGKWTSCSK